MSPPRAVFIGYILCFFCVLAAAGCKLPSLKEAGKAPEPLPEPVQLESVLEELYCFKCHKFDKFLTGGGVFSHKKHFAFDIHCTRCHKVSGHRRTEIFMDACSGCHDVGNISYKAGGLPVSFTHELHAQKYNCSRCHPGPFRLKKNETGITMRKLYAGKLCGECHDGKQAFSARACTGCHDMKAYKGATVYPGGGMGEVVFSHELHKAMFSCTDCHEGLFAMWAATGRMKMALMYDGKLCGACHNGKTAFSSTDCRKCHK